MRRTSRRITNWIKEPQKNKFYIISRLFEINLKIINKMYNTKS